MKTIVKVSSRIRNKEIVSLFLVALFILLVSSCEVRAANCSGICRPDEGGGCWSNEDVFSSGDCPTNNTCCIAKGTSANPQPSTSPAPKPAETPAPIANCSGICRPDEGGGCWSNEESFSKGGCPTNNTCCIAKGTSSNPQPSNSPNPNKGSCPGTCRLGQDTLSGCNSNEEVNMSYSCSNVNEACCVAKGSTSNPAGGSGSTSGNPTGSNASAGGGNISFSPPTKYTTVGQMLSAVTVALKNLVVPVAIIFIVVGGLMYMMSAGNETMIKRARACITGAVIGLAIVLAGPTFLKEIQTISGVSISSELSQQLTIAQIAGRILSFLLSILGIVAIISLVIGGMTYLTAYGNDKRIQSAKTMIQYSIIGIVVALGALIIVRQVMSFF